MMQGCCSLTGPGAAMSAPLHAALTPDQRQALLDLRYDPELRPRVWLRVETLLLSAGGLKVPPLAVHLDCCETTVHAAAPICRAGQGLDAVHPQPLAHRRRIEEALDRLLGRPQTWTVTILSEALAAEEDIHLKPRTVRLYLNRMGAKWRRTHASVRHRQDPELATAAQATLAGLKKRAGTGSWTSSSSTKPASAAPCPPPTPGADQACVPSSPTRTRRADA